MAILNAVIVPAKVLKGGRHKIRISVAHNGETRYIVTDIIVDSIKEFKNGAIVKRSDAAMLNTKLRGILQRYQSVVDDLGYTNGLTCAELIYQIKNAGEYKHRTLKSIFEEYMFHADIKPMTRSHYSSMWNILTGYLNETMLVENVNHGTVLGYDKYLRDRGTKLSTVSTYMSFFMVLLKFARMCGYVNFRVNPFLGYHLPHKSVREAWLSVDEIKKIRDIKTTKKNIQKCRDLFMLSYYLGGINIVDLIKINFNTSADVIRYVRQKTEKLQKNNKYVEFEIPVEAKEIINRIKGADGCIRLSQSQKNNRCNAFFLNNMPKLAETAGVRNVIYYSARKSFSQHAFNLGISESIIDYILGHRVDKGGTSLFAYISVTPEMATNAIRKVLDNLK